jgi:signal transduction histidine kinase
VPELPEELLTRLRQIVTGRKVTESELRAVVAEAEGMVRLLAARVEASERRLTELSRDPESSLSDTAGELRRVEALRPTLEELRGLRAALEVRARELRSQWLLHRAGVGQTARRDGPADEQAPRSETGGR